MKKINILIFPCGSENALEINNALRYSVHVKLFGASSVNDIGSLCFDNYIDNLPNISSDTFDDMFKRILKVNNIDMVFVTHDTVMQYIAKKNYDVFLVNGNERTACIVRSKKNTYELFSNKTWCPEVFNGAKDVFNYPIICKPDFGQGAQDVYKCNNINELDIYLDKVENPILVEYLPNEELTVDCFTDRKRNLIWLQPRSREKVKAGISMRSLFVALNEDLRIIGNDINNELIMRGPWFFQVKKDIRGKWKLLEIACRVSGTMVAQRIKGVNLPLMAVQDYMERDLLTLPYDFVDGIERALFTKPIINIKFKKIYLDFDDTLIIDNKVSPLVISFIYKMLNLGKRVILITRHAGDLFLKLNEYKLNENIFSEIIHINDIEPKSNFIKSADSIFIDNKFSERLEVYNKLNIPVFDVDYIEFL